MRRNIVRNLLFRSATPLSRLAFGSAERRRNLLFRSATPLSRLAFGSAERRGSSLCLSAPLSRNFFFAVIAILLIGTSFMAIRASVHADLNTRVTLASSTVPLVQKAHLLQAADANQQLQLSIGLQMRSQAELDGLLQAMYDPQSPQYQQYLTPDQFNQLFAPTSDQVQQVVAFLESSGFTVTSVAANNMLIDAVGNVAKAQQAFGTTINTYQLGSHTFYANATAPTIPGSMRQLITSINGLDNSVQYYPLYSMANAQQLISRRHTLHLLPLHGAKAQLAGPTSGYGPKDLAGAYHSTPLQSAGDLGNKQTVALFELDGYQSSDIAQYVQNYNLDNPVVTNVLVDGASGAAGQGAIEDELDIEVVAAMAPHANQIIYEGPNTTQGLNDTYNKIVTDNKAQIMTTSWGLCETSTGASELQTLDAIFKQGAAQGISLFAASGDSGAYDCNDTNLAVDSPASDPYVTGVGGTTLQLNNGTYGSESVWSNPNSTNRGPKGSGGGGGLSNTFKLPSWQTGPGVQNKYSNGFRQVPDVTGNADPTNGYAMYCTVTNAGCPSTGWITVGGTSGSAPLWAGGMALINSYLQSQGKKVIGYTNPALYRLFNANPQFPAFHDITSGTNLYYPATGGYDQASGLGSPNIYNIARDLAAPGNTPAPTPTDTPTPSPPPPSLIQNGDFENGQSSWKEFSAKNYEIIDSSNPYTGQYSAYLCGYTGCNDSISQSFTVPNNYTKLTVTYWWYSDTNKAGSKCLDKFSSKLQSSAGTVTLQQSCNTDVTNNWVQETFDVSNSLAAYKGGQVTLIFSGFVASAPPQTSDFFVDDVAVTAQ